MLVPMFYSEGVTFIPWSGCTGKKNRPLLYWTKLVEIPTEQHNRDPAEVLFWSSKCADMFVYSIERPRTQHANLIND